MNVRTVIFFGPLPFGLENRFDFRLNFWTFGKLQGVGLFNFWTFAEKCAFFGRSFVLSKLFTIFVMRLGNNYRGRSLTWLSQTNLFTNLLKIFNYDYDFIDGRKRPNFWGFGFIYSDIAKPTDTFITDKKGQTKRFTKTQAKQLGLIK